MYRGNNIIGFHRVGAPTTTTTAGPTTTTTTIGPTTTTTSAGQSQIYFGSLDPFNVEGIMAINNNIGQTFSITFYYNINANCDNVWSGTDPNQATTEFLISTDSGATWTSIDTAYASIPGGAPQFDSVTVTGYTTITGITNIFGVHVVVSYNCNVVQDGQSGSGTFTIYSATVNFGTTQIICDNEYTMGCPATGATLNCTIPTGTTTTTTVGPTTTTIAPTTTTTTTIAPLNEWFLPSLQELLWMNSNLYTYLGDFVPPPNTWRYWSSSENNASTAWSLYSYSPAYAATAKNAGSIYHVVAVRIFYSATLYNNGDVGPKAGRIFFPNYTNIRQPYTGSTYLYYECQKLADQTIGYTWSNVTNTLVGGTSTAGGTGKANTLLIISQPGHTTSAAKLCYDYNP